MLVIWITLVDTRTWTSELVVCINFAPFSISFGWDNKLGHRESKHRLLGSFSNKDDRKCSALRVHP